MPSSIESYLPKVLVFELCASGHRFEFVRHLIEAIAQLSARPVLATTTTANNSREYHEFLEDIEHTFDLEVLELSALDSLSPYRRSILSLKSFVNCQSRIRPYHSYFPSADGVVQLAGIINRLGLVSTSREFTNNTEALLFSGRFGYRASFREKLRNAIYRLAIGMCPWGQIFHLDPYQVEYLHRHGLRNKVGLMPDPVKRAEPHTKSNARRLLGLPTSGCYVGCAGSIDKRKGCDLLIRAFARLASTPNSEVRLLLAGKVKDGLGDLISSELSKYRDRIVVLDRILTRQEMDLAIQSMDVVCAPYRQPYQSSGIVLRSIAESRPLLVNSSGWLKRTIFELNVGTSCDVENIEEFARCLAEALRKREFHASERVKRFLEFHSVSNFCATWTQNLKRRLGIPSEDRIRSWHWVSDADLSSLTE